MLTAAWEPYAESLANSDDIQASIRHVIDQAEISLTDEVSVCVVCTGIDTRPHSAPLLHDYLERAVAAMGARTVDMGVVTTPMLHFAVQQMNAYTAASSPFGVTASPRAEIQNCT